MNNTVLTQGQEREARGTYVFGSSWNGKGTHMWRLKAEKPELFNQEETARKEEELARKRPLGFEDYAPGWLYNKEKNVYFKQASGQRFWWDAEAQVHRPLYEGEAHPLSFLAGAAAHGRGDSMAASGGSGASATSVAGKAVLPQAPKHVLISDLHAVAKAFKMDLSHLDRPAAVIALLATAAAPALVKEPALAAPVANSSASSSVEAAASLLPKKLLARLAAFRSEWSDDDLTSGISGTLADIATASGGWLPLAAVALVTGARVATVATPGARYAIATQSSTAVAAAAGGVILGAAAAPSTGEALASHCQRLEPGVGGNIFVSLTAGDYNDLAKSLLADDDVVQSSAQQLSQGRPRAASLAVIRALRAAESRASQPSPDEQSVRKPGAVVAACARFGPRRPGQAAPEEPDGAAGTSSSSAPAGTAPATKRPRTEDIGGKVRLRQILLRHNAAARAVDPIRRKPVTRTVEEAEDRLLGALDALTADGCASFVALCKSMSECQSSLKGGELSGDLGWLDIKDGSTGGKKKDALCVPVPEKVRRAAMDLAVGELADLVSSEIGVHLVQRTA